MTTFIIPEIVTTTERLSSRHYRLGRSADLHHALSVIFSRYFGHVQHGGNFDAEGLLVTGESGSGKSTEIEHIIKRFNDGKVILPNGMPARIVSCLLDGKSGWKGLGRKTAKAAGYEIAENARNTQERIWEKVVLQAKAQGIVGIHYDEAQHIFRNKPVAERASILDSF